MKELDLHKPRVILTI